MNEDEVLLSHDLLLPAMVCKTVGLKQTQSAGSIVGGRNSSTREVAWESHSIRYPRGLNYARIQGVGTLLQKHVSPSS